MRRVREHVDRPGPLERVAILRNEPFRVPGEGGRVARDVDDAGRGGARRGASAPFRLGLRAAGRRPPRRALRPSREGRGGPCLRSPRRRRRSRPSSARRSRSRRRPTPRRFRSPTPSALAPRARGRWCRHPVEVVDRLGAGQGGLNEDGAVEPLGHVRIRLQEGVRPDAEAEPAELLLDRLVAPEELTRQVRDLGRRVVDRPVDRPDLW